MKHSPFQKILLALTAFVFIMILSRIIYSGSFRLIFLLWNIFLAWVPYKLSSYFQRVSASNWKSWTLFAAWLLFFPNALYIITDLVHLDQKTNVPIWYDAILIFTAAITGLAMAFASLYKAESFFAKQFKRPAADRLVIICLFLGSFGVYLGRFLRWNSWDVLTNPIDLLIEISQRFISPIDHYRTWAITCLLTGLFSLLYIASKTLPGYGAYPPSQSNK